MIEEERTKLVENKISEMIEMQDTLNKSTAGENWTSGLADNGRTINWLLCIQMEYAELLDSTSWKHWKDINIAPDIENIKMEAVDILHFIISQAIKEDATGELRSGLISISALDGVASVEPHVAVEKVSEFVMHSFGDQDTQSLIRHLAYTCDLFGITFDDLYNLYIVKNTLNSFRQNNGYKEGTYIKIWDKEGHEDNVIAAKLMNKANSSAELLSLLENEYGNVIEESNK